MKEILFFLSITGQRRTIIFRITGGKLFSDATSATEILSTMLSSQNRLVIATIILVADSVLIYYEFSSFFFNYT